ncbi:MAG: hypothetical protein ACRDKB_12110 [Actinomycetota bacterium]
MFVQIIQGKTGDAAGLRRQMDRWQKELAPGAAGYLGATAGVSDKGEFVSVVRFESEDAARKNSDRPEQGEWWTETEKLFDGEVLFHDCNEVDTFLKGGSDDAGFVQIIQGHVNDVDAARRIGQKMNETLPSVRPDVIGGTVAWNPNGRYTETVYFTSEAEARENEKKMADSSEFQSYGEEWDAVKAEEPEYIDLKDPWLLSP